MTINTLIKELKDMIEREGLTGNEEFLILDDNADEVCEPLFVPVNEEGDSFGDLGLDLF